MRVKGSLPNIRQYDDCPNNQANNQAGWNVAIKDDSWEAEEEHRTAVEAKQAEQKKQQEAKTSRRQAKEQELVELKRQLNTGHSSCQNCSTKDQLLKKIKILEQDLNLISGNY